MKGTTLTELIKAYTDQGIGAAQKFMMSDFGYFQNCDDAMMFQVIRFQRKFYPRGKAFFRILSIENSAKHARSHGRHLMQGTNWVKHSSKSPENGEFILFVSEGVMYIGEYGESDIDSNPIVYLRDADGITSVFYGDFEFWMPRPPMPQVE